MMHFNALALASYISGSAFPEQEHFVLTACCADPKIVANFNPSYPEKSVALLPSQALAPYRVHSRDSLGRDYYLKHIPSDTFIKPGDVVTGFTILHGRAPNSFNEEGEITVVGGAIYLPRFLNCYWWKPQCELF